MRVQTAEIDRPARLIHPDAEYVLVLKVGLVVTPEVVAYLDVLLDRI